MKQLALLTLIAACLTSMVFAQENAPVGFAYWSADSLKQLQQELKTEAASNARRLGVRHLQEFPNEFFMLSVREADGTVEWHENQADVFVVQSGSATLLVGGTMVGEEMAGAHEKRAKSIEGGTRMKLSTGDIVRIPAKTPHQLLLDGTKDFTYFVVKIKGY